MQSAPILSTEALQAEIERLRALIQAAGLDPDAAATREPKPDFDRLMFETVSEGSYLVDTEGRTTACNPTMLRLLGFARAEDVIGRSLHEIIHHSHPDGSPYHVENCPIYRAAREGVAMVVDDEVFYRRDGTRFPVEYRTEPLIHEGRLLGAVCTFIDISDRLDAERRLWESQERLALAVRAGGAGIFDFDVRSGRLTWDDRVRELFGLSAGLPITVEANLAAIHAEDRAGVDRALAAAFDPGGSGLYEIQFRAIGIEDGLERWIEARGQTHFAEGQPVRLLGVVRDISKGKQAEHHLHLMVNELNHRVKNSLAMVQGVAAQTFRHTDNMEAARTSFTERLVALARAHDVLTAANWEGAHLSEVVALTVRSHSGEDSHRFNVQGQDLVLSPKTALAFSLALHELATNATKYGALSNATGRIAIHWAVLGGATGQMLRFSWREIGGPAVVPPHRRGFGSKLIERGLASELQGTVRIEFLSGGVVCSIDAPLLATMHRTVS